MLEVAGSHVDVTFSAHVDDLVAETEGDEELEAVQRFGNACLDLRSTIEVMPLAQD